MAVRCWHRPAEPAAFSVTAVSESGLLPAFARRGFRRRVLLASWAAGLRQAGPALSYFLSFLRVRQILRVNTLEVLNASIFEMPDPRSDFVDDVIVVCYQQDSPFICLQGNVEGIDGLQVQVIGGFVEHHEIRLL